jgi:hypothetical protein
MTSIDEAYMSDRAEDKERATSAIAAAIAAIDGEGRKPDPWEREHLYRAIADVFHGAYRLAAADAEKALTPTGARGRLTLDPVLDDFDLAAFRALLHKTELRPPLEGLYFAT